MLIVILPVVGSRIHKFEVIQHQSVYFPQGIHGALVVPKAFRGLDGGGRAAIGRIVHHQGEGIHHIRSFLRNGLCAEVVECMSRCVSDDGSIFLRVLFAAMDDVVQSFKITQISS